jgi:hypothetical protein
MGEFLMFVVASHFGPSEKAIQLAVWWEVSSVGSADLFGAIHRNPVSE